MDKKKLNEILDKHVQKFFAKAPTARFDDVPRETFIDAMEEAINYSHSCTELKDKEEFTFNEWLSHFKKENDCYWLNKETLYCKEAMKLHYDNLPDF